MFKRTCLRTLPAGLFACLAALSTGAAAFADDNHQIEVIRVYASDLEGRERYNDLKRNIRRAAQRVCSAHGVRGVQVWAEIRECRDDAYDRAMLQIDRQFAEAGTDRIDLTLRAG